MAHPRSAGVEVGSSQAQRPGAGLDQGASAADRPGGRQRGAGGDIEAPVAGQGDVPADGHVGCRGQRAAAQQDPGARCAQVPVRSNGDRAAQDVRAALIAVVPREHQRAGVGLGDSAAAGNLRGDLGAVGQYADFGIAVAALGAVDHELARTFESVAVIDELQALELLHACDRDRAATEAARLILEHGLVARPAGRNLAVPVQPLCVRAVPGAIPPPCQCCSVSCPSAAMNRSTLPPPAWISKCAGSEKTGVEPIDSPVPESVPP
ncbi:Uncharacterised protein [Bordetella pertussis]|nr:Uncharacterised protein [Bordetella pertussis]CFM22077.1 Uncharacterised protein [Bordetella pertussis]CFM35646.1 Uncharacterised protein [Bordetella pertussis]CFM39144.1 Uncharacterised protein [Bordetella pertussis]CFM93896.1 Uncharacterised protein [Bordetella pertussis]